MDLSQELLVRGAAAGVFVALAGVIVAPPVSITRWSGALFSVAAAAHTITQLPDWQVLLGIVAPLAWVLSVAAPGLFWAFAITLFDDRKGPLPVLAFPSLLLLVVGGVALVLPAFAVVGWSAHNLAAAALFVHAMLLVWRGWRNDLVEARRRLRGGVLAAAVLYGMAVVGVQLWELAQGPVDSLSPFAAVSLCLLAVAALLAFFATKPRPLRPIGSADDAAPSSARQQC